MEKTKYDAQFNILFGFEYLNFYTNEWRCCRILCVGNSQNFNFIKKKLSYFCCESILRIGFSMADDDDVVWWKIWWNLFEFEFWFKNRKIIVEKNRVFLPFLFLGEYSNQIHITDNYMRWMVVFFKSSKH